MKLIRKRGSTSNILRVFLRDSSSTTGAGKTGLDHTSDGLNISVIADNESTPTTYTSAGSTIETITTLGTFAAPTATKCRFKKVDDTNMPGVCEIHLADARFSVSSSKSIQGIITGTGIVPLPFEIDLEPGTVDDTNATNINTIDDFVDTEITTILNRLGSITGSGTNTILGFFQSLFRSDVTISSDIGGTVTAGFHSMQGLRSGLLAAITTVDDFVDTEITTILNRLGSITGSGANTILGILQAICRSNATLPSDIGGTYAVETHSLQALASAIDTVDNFVDTEIATLLTRLGTTGQGDSLAEVIDNIYIDQQSLVTQVTVIDDFIDTEIQTIITNIATLQTSLNTVDDFVDTEISTLLSRLGSSATFDSVAEAADAAADNSDSNATEIAKIVAEIVNTGYNTFTAHELLRIAAAGAAGKTAGGGSGNETFYDVADGTTEVFVVTISANNRSAVVYFP